MAIKGILFSLLLLGLVPARAADVAIPVKNCTLTDSVTPLVINEQVTSIESRASELEVSIGLQIPTATAGYMDYAHAKMAKTAEWFETNGQNVEMLRVISFSGDGMNARLLRRPNQPIEIRVLGTSSIANFGSLNVEATFSCERGS